MRYLLNCSCGEAVPVSKSQAGTSVTCPACGAVIEVPTIRNLAKLQMEEVVSDTPAPRLISSKWNLPLGIFAGVCFLVLAFTWGLGGLLALERFSLRSQLAELDQWTVEKELEYGDEMVDAYSNADLWDIWDEYKTMGLSGKSPPEHFVKKSEFDGKKRRMWQLFGIGTCALLGIVGVTLLGRRKKQA